MANNEMGLLGRLTGSDLDERALSQAGIDEDIRQGGRLAQMQFGLGQMAAGGLGASAMGLIEGLHSRKQGNGFLTGFREGTQLGQDRITAANNGISVQELRTRRAIRKELGSMEDDGEPTTRLKMARRALEVAQRHGDSASIARAARTVRELEAENIAFDTLKQNRGKQSRAAAYRTDGTPVSGTYHRQGNLEGVLTENGFEPFGPNLHPVDPTVASKGRSVESLDQAVRRAMGKNLDTVKNTIQTISESTHKSTRVMAKLEELTKAGLDESVMGAGGQVIAKLDNVIKGVRGFVRAFAGASQDSDEPAIRRIRMPNGEIREERWSGKKSWQEKIQNDKDLWDRLQLPEALRGTSEEAQEYRASIMELAYMMARVAEPSNRGLSDRDIENALDRIAGSTGNPRVLVERFATMVGDGLHSVDASINNWISLFTADPDSKWTEDQVRHAIGGHEFEKLKKDRQKILERFGMKSNDVGEITFLEGSTFYRPGQIGGEDVFPEENSGITIDNVEEEAKALGFELKPSPMRTGGEF